MRRFVYEVAPVRRGVMKHLIQVAEADDAQAWLLLQRHSPGIALIHRTYVVSDEAVAALSQAGVRFQELTLMNHPKGIQ